MDAAKDPGHGHGHRIELLPLKKRACASRISAGDPYSSSSNNKKRRVDGDNVVIGAETKDTAGALEAPVPRQRRTVPAAASREPAPEELPAGSPAKGNALLSESDEEKKRLSKGKWLAKDESRSSLVTPVTKKLMHDGIRSFIPQQQLRDEHRRRHAAVPPSHGGRSPALSAALERRLSELGATRPWLVLSKTLKKSDVDDNQNRLLVSCKRGSGTEASPITRCFSPAELDRVFNKDVGLCVTAFDRDGSPYDLTCKFLHSNNAYRFINEWKKFVIQNGLESQKHKAWKRDVEVELWAFRSRQLPVQPQLSHHLDPDGALGLLLLHHENRRRAVKIEEEEDAAADDDDDDDWKQGPSLPLPSVARKKKGKQQSGKRGASASPAPVAVAEQISEELLFCAALGLLKLRQSITKQWQEQIDRGGHGAKGDVAKKSSADVEGEKIDEKQKSPGTHSIKELGASSQTVGSLGGNVPLGSSKG